MAEAKVPTPGAIELKTTYVAQDNIWKAYCNKADMSAKTWPNNWGFMIEEKEVSFIYEFFI